MQRERSPEEIRRKELFRELVELSGVKTMADVRNLVKEMTSGTLEKMPEAELEDELGYGKYDYRNEKTENSRNGYARRICLRATAKSNCPYHETGMENSSRR
jgi:transposase-like protein